MMQVENLLAELQGSYGSISAGIENFLAYLEKEYGCLQQEAAKSAPARQAPIKPADVKPAAADSGNLRKNLETVWLSPKDESRAAAGNKLNITCPEDFQQYLARVRDLTVLEDFFAKDSIIVIGSTRLKMLKGKYRRNYDVHTSKYLKNLEKLPCPEDFDEDTNEEVAGKICGLVETHIVNNLLLACHNGGAHRPLPTEEGRYCRAYEKAIEKYLQGIYIRRFPVETGCSATKYVQYFRALGNPGKNKIKEVQIYPYVLSYQEGEAIIEGQAIFEA